MEWKGQFCASSQSGHRVATSPEEWASAWAAVGQAAPSAPDFSQQFAVFVFLGQRNTGGYGVKWLETTSSDTVLSIRYLETKPSGMTMQVMTQPFAVHLFPRTGRQIKVEKASD
ncbi:MAG: protease complex subunit PrcB family protein [Elusimicrobiota bacterium]